MRICVSALALVMCALGTSLVDAETLSISIGIRETGGSGPAFSNAGAGGGIEFVNLDGLTLTADGTWQLFTFTPTVDTLTAFAGATADGVLDVDWASLEHIRVRNSNGITDPIRLWIDDVSNTDSGGTATEGFESYLVGDEVIFQEPNFSGSTDPHLVDEVNTSAVTDTMAFAGDQSYQVDFQFVDGTTTRWMRLTTFNTPNLPNPAMHVREVGAAPTTISFYAKAIVIPEPGTLVLLTLAGLSLLPFRRRG